MSIVRFDLGHIFCHVPKTGGTSMEECKFVGGRGHHKMSVLFNECRAAGHDPKSFFSWAFVRDPADRLQSTYYAFMQYHQPRDVAPLQKKTFRDFIEAFQQHPEWMKRYGILAPQFHFIDEDVSFVGRFEHLERDWNHVCRQVTGNSMSLKHENATIRPRTELHGWVKKVIHELYRTDYQRYYVPE
jgi:hypothetical protein